jgi:hypothetical protein
MEDDDAADTDIPSTPVLESRALSDGPIIEKFWSAD